MIWQLVRRFGPAANGHATMTGIDADGESIRTQGRCCSGDKARVHGRGGADHDSCDLQIQTGANQLQGAEAAAKLDPNSRSNPIGYPGHDAKIIPSPKGTIQIHHVNPAGARVDKSLGHRDRIVPINSLPRRLALTQANDAAGSNVDGR
jgi:hypothetical protein